MPRVISRLSSGNICSEKVPSERSHGAVYAINFKLLKMIFHYFNIKESLLKLRGSIFASHPAALGLIPSFPEIFQRKNDQCC